MKITYTDLLGEYKVLYEEQPDEVKELIQLSEKYRTDAGVQEVMECLTEIETQYLTYTHN
jgi:hypothetical protein